jgi:hypothetical protein
MTRPRDGDRAPWWSEPGEVVCVACEAPSHLEMVVHCAACDALLCAGCTVEATEEGALVLLCRACAEGDG